MEILKVLLGFWLEILVGALILFFVPDTKWFLFYFLVVVLLDLRLMINAVIAYLRVFRTEEELRLRLIGNKLNLSEKDIQKTRDELSDSFTDEQRTTLHQALRKIGESSPERFYRNPIDGLSDSERGQKFIKDVSKKLSLDNE